MKLLVRRSFRSYILSCIKGREENGDTIAFPISDIKNRNSEQVPDALWQELIINHVIYENFS